MQVMSGKLQLRWVVTALALLAIGATACGGGGDGGGGGGGGAGGAEDVVTEWVEGWVRASGVTRDQITASQMRQFLTGDLLAQVEGLVSGGEGRRLGEEGGTTTRIDLEYNKMVGLTIPPSEKPPLTITESTLASDGESATVVVTLHYSDSAAAVASSTGSFGPERIAEVQAEVAAAPPKTFTLIKVEGDWKISAID